MKGKILEYGTILGKDGKKYTFSYDDILNLDKKNDDEKLENLEVDFIPKTNFATEIYLLLSHDKQEQQNLPCLSHDNKQDIKFIKKNTYLSFLSVPLLCLSFLTDNFILELLIIFASTVLFLTFKIRAMYRLSKVSESKRLFNLFLLYTLSFVFLREYGTYGIIIAGYMGYYNILLLSKWIPYLNLLIGLFLFFYNKELDKITNEMMFVLACIIELLVYFFILKNKEDIKSEMVFVMFLFIFLLNVVAWIRFKTINVIKNNGEKNVSKT